MDEALLASVVLFMGVGAFTACYVAYKIVTIIGKKVVKTYRKATTK